MSREKQSGRVLGGRYALVRPLGSELWLARDGETQLEVALRLLSVPSPSERDRVTAGATRSRSIPHSAVVPVIDVVEGSAGELALITELLDGAPLGAREQPIPAEVLCALLLPVCEALCRAHGLGLPHGAIAAKQIFLTTTGAVRLLGFGVPRRRDAEALESGDERAADVHALGQVLFERLAGAPRQGASAPLSSASLPSSLPAALRDLVERMLSPSADRRPTMDQVARGLAGVARPTPASQAPPSVIVRVGTADTSDGLGPTVVSDATSALTADSAESVLRELAAVPNDPRAREPDRTGTRLGHYRVGERLGQGGMGIVYAAEDTRLRRRVALKVLPQSFVASEERRRRFLREARAASSVQHPNVATVFDVGVSDGTVFIAMEHVSGQTLRALLLQAKKLDAVRTLDLALQLAKGLASAHRAGVVHRDIKPENVMVGTDGRARILDFGLAKLADAWPEDESEIEPASGDELASRRGKVMGTPAYMSPEQAAGERVDARADVYAFGVVLFEMLTGTRPAGDVGTRRGLAPAVASVVEKCLRTSPAERYASGEELEDAIATLQPAGRSRVGSALLLLAAIATGAVATAFISGTGVAPPVVSSSPTTSSSASPAPTVLNQVHEPLPDTPHPAALELYRKARLAQHEGDWTASKPLFRQALELDPHLGEALLQLACMHYFDTLSALGETRELYRRAAAERSHMTERSKKLLGALEPLLAREPSDPARALALFDRLLAESPTDVEALNLRATLQYRQTGRWPIADLERIVALDPEYVDAVQELIDAHTEAGSFDEAAQAAEHCHQLSPNSKECAWYAMRLFDATGRCDLAAEEAKRAMGASGWSPYPYILLGLERPRPSVMDAYERAWAACDLPRSYTEGMDRSLLAMHDGDLRLAMTEARRVVVEVRRETIAEGLRWDALRQLAAAAYEAGALPSVAAEIRDELARSAEWAGKDGFTSDSSVAVWAILERGGAATTAELETARAAYATRWSAQFGEAPTWAWTMRFGPGIDTRDAAVAALELAPPTFDKLELLRVPWLGVPIGSALLLAGRSAEAIPWLRGFLSTCSSWSTAWDHVQAQDLLGQALEAQGDKVGACAAYRAVLAHWGAAKPRSLTAEGARRRATRLGCTK